MSVYLLDTNHFSPALRKTSLVRNKLDFLDIDS
jgi:hypothetical protein